MISLITLNEEYAFDIFSILNDRGLSLSLTDIILSKVNKDKKVDCTLYRLTLEEIRIVENGLVNKIYSEL